MSMNIEHTLTFYRLISQLTKSAVSSFTSVEKYYIVFL